jgi:hypothetical protein
MVKNGYDLRLRGLAVLGRVVQLDFSAGALLGRVDDATIKGAGINVQAHGALIELAGIVDAMHRFQRVNGARMIRIHFDGVRSLQLALALVNALVYDPVILHQQATDGHSHPAILVAMIVHRADLANFPADGDQFVERGLVDQISGVVLAVPSEIGREGFWRDRRGFHETNDRIGAVESGRGKLTQFRNKIADRYIPR